MKNIIIVESPGKIQSIQKYVGDQYLVLASNGHIVELAKGGRFGIGVNPLNKFQTFYTLIPEKINFIDQIISNADNIDTIIMATDGDIEGEAIAHLIVSKIKHLNKIILRAEFHEITEIGIKTGLANLRELDINKFKAQETRRILDRIVGFMVSPFLINYYGNNLSAGRVQSVATRLVVELENEINKFKPKEYWNIYLNLINEQQDFIAKYDGKIKSQQEAEQIKNDISQPSLNNSIFKVISAIKKPKREPPIAPLTTAKMQQVMASKFNIEGEATMAAAQILYEAGIITYMRTDSVRISDGASDNVRKWLTKNNFDIPNKSNIFKNKDTSQDAHECIRPTNINQLPEQINLGANTSILYKIIWNYFVSSQMCSAIYDTLNVKIAHTESNHQFKITGKILVEAGYLTILENREKSNNILPSINKDDILHFSNEQEPIKLEQKFTQPPSRYTYASLIKELENKGVGRPSTFVQIISKITDRHYVEKKDNMYYGTELGDKITQILSKYFSFMNYDYTANLEKQMDEISIGKLNYQEILSEFYQSFLDKLKDAHLDNNGQICIKCGAPMYIKGNGDNKFFGCALYPHCMHTLNMSFKNCA